MYRFYLLACLIALQANSLEAQEKKGLFVVYGGKEQFRLEKAQRIPTGSMVSIRGYPLPKQVPRVWLRNAKLEKREELEVVIEPENGSWTASLPSLPPNSETEITIQQFHSLTSEGTSEVRSVLLRMLFGLSAGIRSGHLLEDADAVKMGEAIEKYLEERFPPESTLSQYVRLINGKPDRITLGEELIRMVGRHGATNKELRNLLAEYLDALGIFNGLIRGHLSDAPLPEGKALIQGFWQELPEGLFDANDAIRPVWLKDALGKNPHLLPISHELATALGNFVSAASIPDSHRSLARGHITKLSTPLEVKFASLFNDLRRIESITFSPATVNHPVFISDLLRYGNIDFVQGLVFSGNSGDRLKEVRGFLTFSFFPLGPQERTPDGDSGRFALSLGYSVTGGGDQLEDLYLAGITIRMNRFFSFTPAYVLPSDGTKGNFFIGIAGDLSSLPFLGDLLTKQP